MTIKFIAHGGWIGNDTCIEEGLPWIRPGAARYIESMITLGADVFEWGAGASTIWLARRGCYVTSVELDHEWYIKISQWLKAENLTSRARVIDLSPETMQSIQDGADLILKSDDESYDLVLVDGRGRNRCIGNALSKVKPGGMLVLDDSERPEYAAGLALLDTWDGLEWGDEGMKVTVFHRRSNSIAQRVELPVEVA